MEKNYKLPPVVWLKVTDYMQDWLQHELGGAARIKDRRVVCVQHLKGARDILRMETVEENMDKKPVGNAMSATRKNCIEAGLIISADAVERMYGATRSTLDEFIPIECPKMCLTRNGVLRPWTLDISLSQKQATALQRLLRHEFWKAVADFDREYACRMDGQRYPARDMIEAFCAETDTSDIHADALRREWQRRQKRLRSEDS